MFFDRVLSLTRSLKNLGTEHLDLTQDASLIRRVRLSNVFSLICAAIALVSIPFDWFVAPFWMTLQDAVTFLSLSLVLYLNSKHRHRAARAFLILLINGIIIFDAFMLGERSGQSLILIGLCGMGLVLFDIRERFGMFLASGLPIAAYFLLHFFSPDPMSFHQTPDKVEAYFFYSSVLAFIGIWMSLYFSLRVQHQCDEQVASMRAKAISSEKLAALGEVSGNMAHEINTPLTVLQLNLLLLSKALESGQANIQTMEPLIKKSDKLLMRISRTIRSLQTFSRNADLDPSKPASVREIVNETIELCTERFKNFGVDLIVDPIPDELLVNCRSVQISQVLLNLLNNAFQAVSPLQRRWVRVQAQAKGDFVEISVTDCGEGISPEVRQRMFDPFYSTKDAGKGTGLGLSISKEIMERHHGQLYCDASSPNTRFVMEIPL